MSHPDDPAHSNAKGPWARGESQTTPLPIELDLDDPGTQHWLFVLGNWHAYVAPNPVHDGWPDPARAKADDLLAWMSQAGILALIDSFHDDVSWVVAVSYRLAA